MRQYNLVIVETVPARGEPKRTVIYIGDNSSEAEAVYEKARTDLKNDWVGLFQGISPRLEFEPQLHKAQRDAEERQRRERDAAEAKAKRETALKELEDAKAKVKALEGDLGASREAKTET